MAATAVGHMEPFNPDESIVADLEWMQLYFEPRSKYQFSSIVSVGELWVAEKLQKVSEKPSQKSLKQLKDTLKGHFEPKKVTIAARFQFHQQQQQPGETVTR